MWRLQGLHFMFSPVHRSKDRASRHVFFPQGIISCLPRRKLRMSSRNFCRVLDATCYPWCCMGYRASPWERAGRVADADGGCFCLTADAPARSHLFPRLTGWVLSFGISILSVSVFGLFCDAPAVIATFLPGRCCAALVCCILCVCWDRISRAC